MKAINFPEKTVITYEKNGKVLKAQVQRAFDLESGEISLEAWCCLTGNMLLLFVRSYNVKIVQ